jgi:hypothetical protein
MPYTLDYFVANLKDPVTGRVTEADSSTNMTTYLRDVPELAYLGVGSTLRIDPERIRQNDYSGYRMVRPVEPGEPIRILQNWECPFCATPYHWAEIVVRDNVIESITDVPFTRETFERSHLVADEVISEAAELTGLDVPHLIEADLVSLVRKGLADKEKDGAA